jgi:hypothetical protein
MYRVTADSNPLIYGFWFLPDAAFRRCGSWLRSCGYSGWTRPARGSSPGEAIQPAQDFLMLRTPSIQTLSDLLIRPTGKLFRRAQRADG